MRFNWKPEYDELDFTYLDQHFGGPRGLTSLFSCTRNECHWADHRSDVGDPRIPAKNNTEYHGLERHTKQYHVTAQHDFAYHHCLMAAYWRRADARTNKFNDKAHQIAVAYCVKQALYNKSLSEWQRNTVRPPPIPEEFGLSKSGLDKKDQEKVLR